MRIPLINKTSYKVTLFFGYRKGSTVFFIKDDKKKRDPMDLAFFVSFIKD